MMFFVDELQFHAARAEYERRVERDAQVARASRLAEPFPTAGAASQRLVRILAELYGRDNAPEQDPALFARLAWSGADGD